MAGKEPFKEYLSSNNSRFKNFVDRSTEILIERRKPSFEDSEQKEAYFEMCGQLQIDLLMSSNTLADRSKESFTPEESKLAENVIAGLVAHNLIIGQKERYGYKVTPAEQIVNQVGMEGFMNKIKANARFQQTVENLNGPEFKEYIEEGKFKQLAFDILEDAKKIRENKFSNENKKEQGSVMQ